MSFLAQALTQVEEIEGEFGIEACLPMSRDSAVFLQQLVDWAEFNAQAAYNVLLLSAEIGLEQPFGQLSDRIAALVCAAATVDEMGTQAAGYRDPHAELRKGLLVRAAEFFSLPLPLPRSYASCALARTTDLYRGADHTSSNALLRYAGRLGVHAASEKSAVQEFLLMARAVETENRALLDFLKSVSCPGLTVSAHTWLTCHGGADGVEEIHSSYAFEAAALATERGNIESDTFVSHFFQGVTDFYAVRQEFFRKW